MRVLLPRGRFVPVTPGTRYVTIGGAIACDVHGKSHHVTGSFGDQVVSLDLVLADGTVRTVGPDQDPELFWATVGGMGLTGVILSAVAADDPRRDRLPRRRPRSGCRTSTPRSPRWPGRTTTSPTPSPGSTPRRAAGRSAARCSPAGSTPTRDQLSGAAAAHPLAVPAAPRLAVPVAPPFGLVSRSTVRAFNEAVVPQGAAAPRGRDPERRRRSSTRSTGWRTGTGSTDRAGSCSTSSCVPEDRADVVRRILEQLAGDRHTSFLAVLKRFGPGNSGWLSFPTAGWTLAVDAAHRDRVWSDCWRRSTSMVASAGGRIYLAKDARLRPELMATMYPRLAEFREPAERLDPHRRLQSDLSRRLNL